METNVKNRENNVALQKYIDDQILQILYTNAISSSDRVSKPKTLPR